MRKLGLPSDTEETTQLLEENWEELEIKDFEVEGGEERKRKAFMRVLKCAVDAGFEGNVDSVRAEVRTMSANRVFSGDGMSIPYLSVPKMYRAEPEPNCTYRTASELFHKVSSILQKKRLSSLM